MNVLNKALLGVSPTFTDPTSVSAMAVIMRTVQSINVRVMSTLTLLKVFKHAQSTVFVVNSLISVCPIVP